MSEIAALQFVIRVAVADGHPTEANHYLQSIMAECAVVPKLLCGQLRWVHSPSFANTSTTGWQPRYDFGMVIDRLRASEEFRSPLARAVGSKGYHAEAFSEGPYPT